MTSRDRHISRDSALLKLRSAKPVRLLQLWVELASRAISAYRTETNKEDMTMRVSRYSPGLSFFLNGY